MTDPRTNDGAALIAASVERLRDDVDVALLALRVQMQLAERRGLPLSAIANATRMRTTAARRMIDQDRPCRSDGGCIVAAALGAA